MQWNILAHVWGTNNVDKTRPSRHHYPASIPMVASISSAWIITIVENKLGLDKHKEKEMPYEQTLTRHWQRAGLTLFFTEQKKTSLSNKATFFDHVTVYKPCLNQYINTHFYGHRICFFNIWQKQSKYSSIYKAAPQYI